MTGLFLRNALLQPAISPVMSKYFLHSAKCASQSLQGFSIIKQTSSPAALILVKKFDIQYCRGTNVSLLSKVYRIPNVCCRHYSDKALEKGSTTVNLATTCDTNENNSNSQSDPKKGSKFKRYAIYTVCVLYGTMFLSILYNLGLPAVDEDGFELRDEFSDLPPLEQFFKRMFDRLYVFKEFLRRPSRDKLLPDPNPLGHPKYTLVLELTHVLLHPDWTYQTGWRFKKRPNLDHFLEQLASPMYEIVVFTSQVGMNAAPIVDALNRGSGGSTITYSLYRDATEFINGEYVKNLSCLNRDLSKVIVVDWNPNVVHLQPENSLILPKWDGNDDDNTLVELVAFLKNVAEKSPEDVRQILSYYKQFSDPLENFRDSQRKLPELPEVPSA